MDECFLKYLKLCILYIMVKNKFNYFKCGNKATEKGHLKCLKYAHEERLSMG